MFEFQYFHFPILPIDTAYIRFASKLSQNDIKLAYGEWLNNNTHRQRLFYRGQWDRHYSMARSAFASKYELLNNEDVIQEYVYEHETEWNEFFVAVGLENHRVLYQSCTERVLKLEMETRKTSTSYGFGLTKLLDGTVADPYFVRYELDRIWFHAVTYDDTKDIKTLRAMPYSDYLKTPHWRQVKAAAFIVFGARCTSSTCPGGFDGYWHDTDMLHVHHLTYKNRGAEQLDDIRTLCERCHRKLHKGESEEVYPSDLAIKFYS